MATIADAENAAAYVGVSYWTLRDLVLNGTVPAVRVPSGRITSGATTGRSGKPASWCRQPIRGCARFVRCGSIAPTSTV